MMWLWLLGCVGGRAPLSFDADIDATGCDGVSRLSVPLERMWLQQPTLARAWSAVPSAHAHPGHDPAGDVTGEIVGPWTVEPCAAATRIGPGSGYESLLGSGQLVLLGEARLAADLDGVPVDVTASLDASVPGIPLDGRLADGARARLVFDPWLTLSVLPTDDSDGDGRLTGADTGVTEAFRYGLSNPNSWTLSLEDP